MSATWEARFPRVAVVGVGLMGGSILLDLRAAAPGVVLAAHDRDWSPAARALAARVGALQATSLESAAEQASLIVLAVPVEAILELLPRLAAVIAPGTVVTDVGGAKAEICAVGRASLAPRGRFVGGHPMCGAERAGAEAARPGLFAGRAWILCPEPPAGEEVGALESLLRGLGAQPLCLSPRIHDAIAARVSHLPQLVAVALLGQLAAARLPEAALARSAAGGFRDLSRIGSSSFGIWRSVLAANREEILAAMAEFQSQLDDLRARLEQDPAALEGPFETARDLRRRLEESGAAGDGSGRDPGDLPERDPARPIDYT